MFNLLGFKKGFISYEIIIINNYLFLVLWKHIPRKDPTAVVVQRKQFLAGVDQPSQSGNSSFYGEWEWGGDI